MQVAISSMAFKDKSIIEIIEIAQEEGWVIEFSSGIKYDEHSSRIYKEAKIPRMLHNYFPPPKNPFVLNIASLNSEIQEKSVEHCKQGLKLAKISNGPFFSAHAGFCGDPLPEELGHPIKFDPDFDRKQYMSSFINNLNEILKTADELEVDFLIENNVCAEFNLTKNGKNPLLCSDPDEIIKVFNKMNHKRFGLLLDTGHLKVSGNALGFDIFRAVNELSPFIRGIHHSDNDGMNDSNNKIDTDYWFFKKMTMFKDIIHVLEINSSGRSEIKDQINLLTL